MITVEIYELTSYLRLVEVKKKSVDRKEYEEFCDNEQRTRLQPPMFCRVLVNHRRVWVLTPMNQD